MRIGVNTRFLINGQMEGLGLYTQEVVRRMVQSHPEDEFYFYFDRPYDEQFIYGKNVIPRVVSPPARHAFLWYIWFEWTLPKQLKADQVDVFFSPDGFSSLSYPGKKAVVMHDLGFEHYPDHVPYWAGKFYRRYSPLYAQDADHVFAVSESTKADIIERYDVDSAKISLAYNGVRPSFRPLRDEEKTSVRQKITGGAPYFLFVGAMHPRKNVAGLLRAFDLFKKNSNASHKLLITGRKAWMTSDIETVYNQMEYAGDVIFLGYLDEEELTQITGAAFACLYLSLFEGFGVPLLEAMTCGIPIIASNVSCMPEIVGNAGWLVPPVDAEEVAQKMVALTNSPEAYEKLSNHGLQRSNEFSWDQTANHIYQKLADL